MLLIASGLALIVASFLPFGNVASSTAWTEQDADAYTNLSLEYHRSAYEPPSRAGMTPEEMKEYREQLRQKFESLKGRLERAQQRPKVWSRWLLWSGAALVTIGAVGFYWQRVDH